MFKLLQHTMAMVVSFRCTHEICATYPFTVLLLGGPITRMNGHMGAVVPNTGDGT